MNHTNIHDFKTYNNNNNKITYTKANTNNFILVQQAYHYKHNSYTCIYHMNTELCCCCCCFILFQATGTGPGTKSVTYSLYFCIHFIFLWVYVTCMPVCMRLYDMMHYSIASGS